MLINTRRKEASEKDVRRKSAVSSFSRFACKAEIVVEPIR